MRPQRPLLALAAGWTALAVAASLVPALVTAWQAAGVLLGGLALLDLVRLLGTPDPALERQIGRALPLGVWTRVRLLVENRSARPLQLTLHDLHPGSFEVDGLPRRLRLAGRERIAVTYRLRPPARGDFEMTDCDLRPASPLGLWSRRRRIPLPEQLRVYPNFAEIGHYALLATHDRLAQLGVRVHRRRGTGTELHQLREHRRGDSLRQIDWKATARLRKLISREYQDERDQRVVLLLDCGRRMRHADQEGGHLDEAINALLLLAYVAVRQGDAVGLLTYGGARRQLAPRKGMDTVNRLLEVLYDLQPTLEASDPLAASQQLLRTHGRRSLVVLVTNSRDEDCDELESAVRALRHRHLVVIADLRESAVDRVLAEPVNSREAALRFHAVQGFLEARRHHHERLHHLGAHVIDLRPAQLPIALVNRYLDLKRSGTF